MKSIRLPVRKPVFPYLQRTKATRLPANGSHPLLALKRILVPTDFSRASLKALRYAVRFAQQFGSTVFLVHVVDPNCFVSDLANLPFTPAEEELIGAAREKLSTLAYREVEEMVPVKSEVRVGKPFLEIINAARALEAELIIIATHRHDGWNHFLQGSTAERVVRHAPCPALVVGEHEHEFL